MNYTTASAPTYQHDYKPSHSFPPSQLTAARDAAREAWERYLLMCDTFENDYNLLIEYRNTAILLEWLADKRYEIWMGDCICHTNPRIPQ